MCRVVRWLTLSSAVSAAEPLPPQPDRGLEHDLCLDATGSPVARFAQPGWIPPSLQFDVRLEEHASSDALIGGTRTVTPNFWNVPRFTMCGAAYG